MRQSEFEHNKRSLIKVKRVMDICLNEEVQKNWNEISSEEYVFGRNLIEAECIATITKKELIEFLMNKSNELRKISVQTIGNATSGREEGNDTDMDQCDLPRCMTSEYITTGSDDKPTIRDLEAFKNGLFVYPLTKTIIDFESNHARNN